MSDTFVIAGDASGELLVDGELDAVLTVDGVPEKVAAVPETYVTGTFTAQEEAGVQAVDIPYTGRGYPLAAVVVVDGGAYNSANATWYNSLQRYAVGQWTMSKSAMTSKPTYTTSGAANQGVITAVYKNSTTAATTYSRTSAMSTNAFSSSNATNAATTCCRFKSSKKLSVYIGDTSYGLLPGLKYRYFVIYSA